MPPKASKPPEEGDPGAPAWMTTFSDCMTLLLTFFVLLLSFSSFDEGALRKISGSFDTRPLPSIMDNFERADGSLAPELDPVVDRTEKGDEIHSQDLLEDTENPKVREPVYDKDAYDDQKIFYIPTKRLFLGRGSVLTRQGRDYLSSLAAFMKIIPCKVIVGEVTDGQTARGMDRAWAVIEHLTVRDKLAGDRFRLAAAASAAEHRFRGEPVMMITLLTSDFTTE